MVLADLVCMAGALLQSIVINPRGSLRVADLIYLAGFALVFGIVGWIIAAPIALMLNNITGWRFWLYWALGSSFGPLSMLSVFALVYYLVPGNPNEYWIRPELMPLVYLATAISSLTALFFLLLLRRAQGRLR